MRLFKALPALAILALLAMAAPTEVQAQAQVIRSEGMCGVFAAGGFTMFECRVQHVITPEGKVNTYIHGTILDGQPVPAKAEKIDNASTGQICTGLAPEFKGVITPGGQINITCRG